MRPNVLLIVLDAARADHFEPYGAPTGSTPVIADLARRGRHVPLAYAAASWTVPSHAALFTGLLPRAAGLARAPEGTPKSCRPRLVGLRDRLLPEVLRRTGYETRALSTNAWLLPESGFDTGFERFELIDPSRDLGFGSQGRRHAARAMVEALRARVDDGAAEAGKRLRAWAGKERNRPFFWFVNLVEAHSPYLPPKPFNPLGPISRARAALEARRYLNLNSVWRTSLGLLEVPADAIERMRSLYAAAIRQLDACIGDALEALDHAGLLDDTLVIVTADHGENLGESGMLGHSFSLDERLLRVPLVAAGPVGLGGADLLSLASLPNRLGAALELPAHPWDEPLAEGVAVAQFDPPTGPGDPRNEVALKRWGIQDRDGGTMRRFTSRLTCATDGRRKLLARGDALELFDLKQDPLEQNPRPVKSKDTEVERLREALDIGGDAPVTDPETPLEADPADEVEDLEKRMRLLGYL